MDISRHVKRDVSDDGWGGFEAYMKIKEGKQAAQFKRDALKYTVDSSSSIFKGVSIYVNGYTDPPAEKLKKLMMVHGGRYIYYPNKSNTTHVIANNLAYTKIKELKNEKVVTPQWIIDSVKAGRLLSHVPYLLYQPTARSNQTLHRFSPMKSIQPRGVDPPKSDDGNSLTGTCTDRKKRTKVLQHEAVTSDTKVSQSFQERGPGDSKSVGNIDGTGKQGRREDTLQVTSVVSGLGRRTPDTGSDEHKSNQEDAKRPLGEANSSGTIDKDKVNWALRRMTEATSILAASGNSVGYNTGRYTSGKSEMNIVNDETENKQANQEGSGDREGMLNSGKLKNCHVNLDESFKKVETPFVAKSPTRLPMLATDEKVIEEDTQEILVAVKRSTQRIPHGTPSSDEVSTMTNPESTTGECDDEKLQEPLTPTKKTGRRRAPSTDDLSSDGIAKCLKMRSQMSSAYFPKATDPNFLPTFYRHSSFYHLTTWRSEHRLFVKELKANNDGVHPGKLALLAKYGHRRKGVEEDREKSVDDQKDGCEDGRDENGWHSEDDTQIRKRLIMHIDMDAFFVLVSLLNYPELRGKPVAVAHYAAKAPKRSSPESPPRDSQQVLRTQSQLSDCQSNSGSTSPACGSSGCKSFTEDDEEGFQDGDEKSPTPVSPTVVASEGDNFSSLAAIASCSYEARACGVRNGMIMKLAKELCPDLRTIPYDFDGYYRVSRLLYKVVASYTNDLQAASCDEVILDVTNLMDETGATGVEIANAMRREIFEKTSCTASAGLAPNVILARLCTKRAKPDGVYVLKEEDVEEFLKKAPVGDLPGIGRAFAKKMHDLSVYTCADLQEVSIKTLQKEFGQKTGDILYRNCRGQDTKPMSAEKERKYVSVEVNYGIRFDGEDDAHQFIHRLSTEVQRKLQRLFLVGRSITLKLKVRRAGTPVEDIKYMGYGVFDNKIKTVSLSQETDNAATIYRTCKGLLVHLAVVAKDIRGVGIQISKLKKLSSLKGMSKPITELLQKKGDASPKTVVTSSPTQRIEKRGTLFNYISPKKPKSPALSPVKCAQTNRGENETCALSPLEKSHNAGSSAHEEDCRNSSVSRDGDDELESVSRTVSGNISDQSPSPAERSVVEKEVGNPSPQGSVSSFRKQIPRGSSSGTETKGTSSKRKLTFNNRSPAKKPKSPMRCLWFGKFTEDDVAKWSVPMETVVKSSYGAEDDDGDKTETVEKSKRDDSAIWRKNEMGSQRGRESIEFPDTSKSSAGGKVNNRLSERREGTKAIPSSERIKVMLDGSNVKDPSLHPLEIDVAVLKSLPADIREQVISQYNLDIGSSSLNRNDPNRAGSSTDSQSGLDQEVLRSLPPSLLQEVLEAESGGGVINQQTGTSTDRRHLKDATTSDKILRPIESRLTAGKVPNKTRYMAAPDRNVPGKMIRCSPVSPNERRTDVTSPTRPSPVEKRRTLNQDGTPTRKKKPCKITNYLCKRQKPSTDDSPTKDVSPNDKRKQDHRQVTPSPAIATKKVAPSRSDSSRRKKFDSKASKLPVMKRSNSYDHAAQAPSRDPNECRSPVRERTPSCGPSTEKDEIRLGGASTIEGVKLKLKQWTHLFEIPLDEDISHVVHFLRSLILDRNLAMVYQLLRAFKRVATNNDRKEWMDAYDIITERVQNTVGHIYGGSLKLD